MRKFHILFLNKITFKTMLNASKSWQMQMSCDLSLMPDWKVFHLNNNLLLIGAFLKRLLSQKAQFCYSWTQFVMFVILFLSAFALNFKSFGLDIPSHICRPFKCYIFDNVKEKGEKNGICTRRDAVLNYWVMINVNPKILFSNDSKLVIL